MKSYLCLLTVMFAASAFAQESPLIIPEAMHGSYRVDPKSCTDPYASLSLDIGAKGLQFSSRLIQYYLDTKGRTNSYGEERPTSLTQTLVAEEYADILHVDFRLAGDPGTLTGPIQLYRWLEAELVYERQSNSFLLRQRIGSTSKLLWTPLGFGWNDWLTCKMIRTPPEAPAVPATQAPVQSE